MRFTTAASVALAAATVSGQWANGSYASYTTKVVTAFTTYCPEATEISHAGRTYTVTQATTLVIDDCPCTLTQSLNASAVVTSYKPASSSAAVVVSSTSLAPVVVSPVLTSTLKPVTSTYSSVVSSCTTKVVISQISDGQIQAPSTVTSCYTSTIPVVVTSTPVLVITTPAKATSTPAVVVSPVQSSAAKASSSALLVVSSAAQASSAAVVTSSAKAASSAAVVVSPVLSSAQASSAVVSPVASSAKASSVVASTSATQVTVCSLVPVAVITQIGDGQIQAQTATSYATRCATTTSALASYTGAAAKNALGASGAGLAAVFGLAAYFL